MADPLYIPDEFAQVFLRWRCTDDPEEMVCTLGVKRTDGTFDAQELAVAADDAMQAAGSLGEAGGMTDEYSYVGTKVILQTAGGLDIGQVDDTVVGTAVEDALVNNSAILVKKITASAGRWNRGRWFLPPAYVHNGVVSANGMITAGARDLVQDRVEAFQLALQNNAAVELLYLFHYPRTDPPSPSPDPTPDPTPILSFSTQVKLATVRKRLRP